MITTAYIALGSNVGDREGHLQAALAALRQQPGIRVMAVSRFWQTAPVGGPPGQDDFLNAAAQVETNLPPHDLMNLLLTIEQNQGRLRQERYGPRTLDLDLLLYGNSVLNEPGLSLPHPRMHERAFVLGPLAEIEPTLKHPVFHQSVVELLAGLRGQDSGVRGQELRGRTAVVTGSSTGIGRAMALALAERGADVNIHHRKSAEQAAEVRDRVRRSGVRSDVIAADLRDPAACQKLVTEAYAHPGSIDIWINNAGADTLTGEAAHLAFEEKLRELMAVDVAATMFVAREVGRRMKAVGQGTILNMGWDQAETGMEGDSGQLFAAAKGAVMAFTKSLALTLAPEVRVNCLAPGWIRTAWGESASGVWQERAVREAPLRRWGTPEDVAQVACWLVSPAASFVTGQIIRVNGGAIR